MVIITIRDIEPELSDRIKTVANSQGKTQQTYIKEVIERCVREDEIKLLQILQERTRK